MSYVTAQSLFNILESSHATHYDYAMPLISIWAWYRYLFTAHRIEVTENKDLIFSCLLKKTTVTPDDILWIKETIGFVIIKHSAGRIYISTLINEVPTFKSTLLSLNSNIETKYAIYRGGEYK
jgi:hypothetical protein